MIRPISFLVVALALAACAGPGRPYGPRHLRPTANPSAVIAAELAFARAAQEKGQWSAFADYATDDAVMFVPEPVRARDWLRGRANPAKAVTWQPHQVWSSCDGSLAVTKGAWQRPDGTVGYFTTVWQRQKDDSYKWVLDQGDALDTPLAEPEMVQADVADCANGQKVFFAMRSAEPVNQQLMESEDSTLVAMWQPTDDGRKFSVLMHRQDRMEEVLSLSIANR